MSLIAGTVLLSGCDSALLDPKGQIGLEQRSLILTAFGLMMIVVIPAVLMAVGFAWKYRASNKDAKYSPNWSHSNKVEAVVWTVPILIIIFLAVLTWKTTHALEPSKPLAHDEKPITIEVVSMDWKWFFIYPSNSQILAFRFNHNQGRKHPIISHSAVAKNSNVVLIIFVTY